MNNAQPQDSYCVHALNVNPPACAGFMPDYGGRREPGRGRRRASFAQAVGPDVAASLQFTCFCSRRAVPFGGQRFFKLRPPFEVEGRPHPREDLDQLNEVGPSPEPRRYVRLTG
jgi:hypothetical protein